MKEDLRIVKTKKALSGALFALLEEKSFDDLTVNELCTRAGVRRATFYKHFRDKYAFMTYIISSLRDEFDSTFSGGEKPEGAYDYYEEYLTAFISFLAKNEGAVKGLIGSNASVSLVGLIMQQNYTDTLVRLQRSYAEGMPLPASPESVASMLTGGFGNIILLWLSGGMTVPKEEIITESSALLRKILG